MKPYESSHGRFANLMSDPKVIRDAMDLARAAVFFFAWIKRITEP